MSKLLSVIGGTVAIVIGAMLFFAWNEAFVLGIQFSVMLILVFGGLIALVAGISEIKDSLTAKKEESADTKEEKSE